MEQFRRIGEALGSIKALMVFKAEIQINPRQCCLLADAFDLAFESIAEEMRQAIKQCLEPKDWLGKAIALSQNMDCVEFHMHNLLWCVSVVLESIESVMEISGCDQEEIGKKRLLVSSRYEKDCVDPRMFQLMFGKQHLVSQEMGGRFSTVRSEDQWLLAGTVSKKRPCSSKLDNHLTGLLVEPKEKLFPLSLLTSSDYQVRRRLGDGSQYKEVHWMGEAFAARHLFGDIKPLEQEISLLQSLAHPNVMHVMYAFSDEQRKECILIMELMNKDLFSYTKEVCSAKRKVSLPLLVSLDTMLQIARGMEYLHSRKIYHGDLNPANMLVKARSSTPEGYLQIKIGGIGLRFFPNRINQEIRILPSIPRKQMFIALQ